MGRWEDRLDDLGMEIPDPLPVRGRFRPVVLHGPVAYTSGAIATTGPPLRVAWPGRVGDDVSLDEAKSSACGALLATLANLRAALGDLDRVAGFLHLNGYVRVAPGFDKVHHVVGAASALVGDVLGDELLPARTAVGAAELPEGASVVLDAVVAVTG